nr:hypothetical protein CFP56_38368 [Quercus suber]
MSLQVLLLGPPASVGIWVFTTCELITLTKELQEGICKRCHYIANSVIKEIGNGTLMVEVYELMWLDIRLPIF